MDVSIIIVSWNTKDILRTTLRSLYDTIHRVSFEVFVVDNDSSDGSPEMVETEFPDVRLIQTGANLGFARANNIGIHKSTGRYVCLVNSDVEVFEETVDKMSAYLDDHPDIGMLGPRTLNPDRTLQRSFGGFPTPWRQLCRSFSLDRVFPRSRLFAGGMMSYFDGDRTMPVDILYGAFWLIRREALDDVGLLDESFFMYSEDKDWCRRFVKAGWKVIYYADAEIIHYGGASSAQAPVRYYLAMLHANLQYWRKHHGIFGYLYLFKLRLLAGIFHAVTWRLLALVRSGQRRDDARYKAERSAAVVWFLARRAYAFWGRIAGVGAGLVWYAFQLPVCVVKRLAGLQRPTAVILSYHTVTAGNRSRFEHQMRSLVKAGQPVTVTLDDKITKGRHHVAVSFDGGFACIWEYALPVMRELGIPAAVFVPTAYIGRHPGWITDLHDAKRFEPLMTADQIRDLAGGNMVAIGSLTHAHSPLVGRDTDDLAFELAESKRILSEITGRNIDLLAAPYGAYDDAVVMAARHAAYRALYGTLPSWTGTVAMPRPYVRGRIACSPDDWAVEFFLKVRGAYQWVPLAMALKRRHGVSGRLSR